MYVRPFLNFFHSFLIISKWLHCKKCNSQALCLSRIFLSQAGCTQSKIKDSLVLSPFAPHATPKMPCMLSSHPTCLVTRLVARPVTGTMLQLKQKEQLMQRRGVSGYTGRGGCPCTRSRGGRGAVIVLAHALLQPRPRLLQGLLPGL